ncbi:pyridoxamine 5'-phosphate oxidase family protein [Cognatishimia sp. SS12]|uniref:pyridoxamine 5'-phosphate oxidase family protein n=1 Tax=Cognatishimia sp. SS12 TaxID=2979465 RepID=UPI00232B26F7|nr:pyridoxamine 5'-phosphate oxidase family protein [Cognatishimia sp. SS12]MDC0737840.1 pyridoxamine 5'-phosphate oxidase family protein [Cognatishimia sp. SS12]
MAHKPETDADAAKQLWKRLEDTRTGMLSVDDDSMLPQPMTHFIDPEGEVIWFITSQDTELVEALKAGADATYCYQSQKGDYHASIRGPLVLHKSEEKLDELWSVPLAAWFEQGRDDPKVTLLQFTPRKAAIWASDGNPVLVGLKMINAAMRDDVHEPDVGISRVIDFTKLA